MNPEPYPPGHVPDDLAGSGAAGGGPAAGRTTPDGGASTSAGSTDHRPGALRRGRLRFRGWRRSRPFWGGLLLILAGAEILLLPLNGLLAHSALKVVIYIGIGGVFGVVIGGLLIACGLLAWFHPVQRVFYGIVGALLAIASFPATNLGGFFLGMLSGVFGASLVFAWSPVQPEGAGRHRHRHRGRPGESGGPGDVPGEPGAGQPSRRGRLLALPAVPLLLFGTLAPAHAPALPGQPAPAVSTCILPSILSFLCPPSSSPSPAAAGPSGSQAGPATAGPPASPSPSAGPAVSAAPGVTASPSPAGRGSPTASPGPSVNANARKRAAAAPSLVAASAPATLTAGSALMAGLTYDGVATVPTAGGPQRMLKFSMSSLTLSGGIALTVSGNGHTMVTRNTSVQLRGNVVLYATRLSGDLLGIPLSFTPGNPPPLVLPLMQFTNVVTEQPLTAADSMQAGGLDITSS